MTRGRSGFVSRVVAATAAALRIRLREPGQRLLNDERRLGQAVAEAGAGEQGADRRDAVAQPGRLVGADEDRVGRRLQHAELPRVALDGAEQLVLAGSLE